jgi:hypothetical protein
MQFPTGLNPPASLVIPAEGEAREPESRAACACQPWVPDISLTRNSGMTVVDQVEGNLR